MERIHKKLLVTLFGRGVGVGVCFSMVNRLTFISIHISRGYEISDPRVESNPAFGRDYSRYSRYAICKFHLEQKINNAPRDSNKMISIILRCLDKWNLGLAMNNYPVITRYGDTGALLELC